jgi:hypothetical protein
MWNSGKGPCFTHRVSHGLVSPKLPITYMHKHKGEEGEEAIPPTGGFF